VNRRLPFSRHSEAGKLPRQQEQEILAAASKVFRTAFPNSERAGCPPQTALRSVVQKRCAAGEGERILEHMTCCSACFGEYEGLLRKERVSRSLKLLALCATLLITTGAAIWFNTFRGAPAIRQNEPLIVQKAPSPTPPPPTPVEIATIDLRNRSTVRGETGSTSGDVVVTSLPAQRLDLTIYLPIGSEEGRYQVAILRAEGNPLVAVGGSATLQNRKVTLQLRTDLTGFAPGRYLLGVRKGSFRWAYYPIALAK
jgi:hypothetical protein